MAGKALNSRFLLSIKFVSGGQKSASKTATNHMQTVMCNAKTMRLNILIFTFLIFLFSNCVYSQKYLYQSICYIGGEVKEERVDTLVYKPGFDLEFIQKNLIST